MHRGLDHVAKGRTIGRLWATARCLSMAAYLSAWLASWHGSTCCVAEDRPKVPGAGGIDSQTKSEADDATQLARDEVEKWDLHAGGGESAKLALVSEPVLRWTNPYVGRVYGSVFLWTADGRPAAVASVFRWYSPREEFYIELKSLTPERLTGSRGGREVWRSRPAKMEWSVLTGGGAPRATARERLQQMRQLARDFSAELVDRRNDADGRKVQLRLLPQPIFRFDESKPMSSDGALFCFVQGTDPEVLLLLQVSRSASAEWEYSLARLNTDELTVRHRSHEVWQMDSMDFAKREQDDDYVLFKIYDDDVHQ
jgi:hypothetical protein